MLRKIIPCLILLGSCLLLLTQCVPSGNTPITDVNLDLKDPVYRQIYSFQDQLKTDSLIPFFKHRDPSYRYAAALAFGSNRDKAAIEGLSNLLSDEVPEVKIAAAYALGQIGEASAEDALVQAFATDTMATDQKFKRTVLEAVGKSASKKYLAAISSVTTYRRTDTLALEGQAYGIYRYALRGMVSQQGTQRMVDLLVKSGYPKSVRLIAANYLYRTRQIQLDTFAGPLYQVVQQESDPKILQALAIALGKTKRPVGLEALKYVYGKSADYRVRVQVIRALGNYDYALVKDLVLAAVTSANTHIAIAASEFLIEHGYSRDAEGYYIIAKNTAELPWQVRTNLLRAANKHTPVYFTNKINNNNNEIKLRFDRPDDNIYEKAALIRALSEYGWNYKYIYNKGFQSEQSLIRAASVDALSYIAMNPDFKKYFAGSARRVKAELAQYFKEAIERGDISMIASAAQVLRVPELNFRENLDSLDFLNTAISKLTIPKETEIQYELQKTIDHFNNKSITENPIPAYNHPIDWNLIEGINSDAEAKIITSKGEITLALMLQHAPATVSNFVQLVRNNFYDNINFHRVIPNFVVQGGCPRGDGYGGLDYTIRSELGMAHYDDEGYVGMASAGNHTECTQWFITHTPTPHLDGNYTIFARVVEGMEVVQKLQIGDRITDIRIQN